MLACYKTSIPQSMLVFINTGFQHTSETTITETHNEVCKKTILINYQLLVYIKNKRWYFVLRQVFRHLYIIFGNPSWQLAPGI